jgi:hypothetical protein
VLLKLTLRDDAEHQLTPPLDPPPRCAGGHSTSARRPRAHRNPGVTMRREAFSCQEALPAAQRRCRDGVVMPFRLRSGSDLRPGRPTGRPSTPTARPFRLAATVARQHQTLAGARACCSQEEQQGSEKRQPGTPRRAESAQREIARPR